jgi:dimethylglycine dehydrogenase
MKQQYQAVVIGGGVVGASVLYHLTTLGWPDVLMIERSELTAGSTWHAAAGFHALNGDPNVAALQDYTIKLYKELEAESGQSLGVHWTGGVNFASTPERWEWLQSAWATFQTVGIESARLIGVDEIRDLAPIADLTGVYGGLYDENEGHLDAAGTTYAYVAAARRRGAEVVLHNRVLELTPRPAGGWSVVTEQGTVTCEHVVNAAGLWARQVGRMAGVELPVAPMEHHYLVTEEVPELAELAASGRELPMMVDLEGFTYLRQEGRGVLLGVYETRPQHWNTDGVPWDYGLELIPQDVERIEPELAKGFERYPCLNEVGIKKWVNGAFTFTPDGNPLVGPVPGLPGYWVACGVMAGFSQGGGVGLSLAEWMIGGEPSRDVFGMDVARYGRFAGARPYLKATTAQFYARRFMMAYPNEQLPAGRPLAVSPLHDRLDAAGARWGVNWGLETPLYFAPSDPGFVETPTLRRSNAFGLVGGECRLARSGVALLDTTSFSRYEVRGPQARQWLDRVLACRLPKVGRARLAPMLSESGRLLGDLTVFCWAPDEYWLMGSYYLRAWHLRRLTEQLPSWGVALRDLSDDVAGVALVGPRSRELLQRVTADDVSGPALPFLGLATIDAGLARARVGRLSVTGELGFELNLPATQLRGVYDALVTAGEDLGVAPLGYNAVNSLRLEKSFGIWSREFTWAYTPGMSGLDRFVAFEKPDFVGRDAALRERDHPPSRVLVTLDVDAVDCDATAFEPVWLGERRIGLVTSGGYGHTLGRSLAMAYLDRAAAAPGTAVEVHILGVRRPATVIAASPVDPAAAAMRG